MNKEELTKQIELLVKDDEKSQETIIKQSQEIERLKQNNEYLNKVNIELSTLNTSLRSDRDNYKYIIKDVREYIKDNAYWGEETEDGDFVSGKLLHDDDITYLEEILNKGE